MSAVLSLVAHWLSLWLGLYLISRKPRTAVSVLAGAAIVSMSSYLLCTVLLVAVPELSQAVWVAKVLGPWSCFAPVLLLHAICRLVSRRSRADRAVLAVLYAFAAIMAVLSVSDTLVYDYWSGKPASAADYAGFPPGPLYWLMALELVVPLAVAAVALVRMRTAERERGAGKEAGIVLAGVLVMLVASVLLLANTLSGGVVDEGLLQPPLLIGAVMVAVPLARYPGLAEGQLLRSDLKSSLLGALLLMLGFVVLVELTGEPLLEAAAVGWFVLAGFVFVDDVRELVDRAVYGPEARLGRTSMRMAMSYAGTLESLDLSSISPEQYATLIEVLGEVDQASLASRPLRKERDPRLKLLQLDEFAAVRQALGLPEQWQAADGLPEDLVRAHVVDTLQPRERQALGLKSLGYTDKQMANLMGIKAGVPRSYVSDAKRKLGLPAGAPLMLFVHFSGVVEKDAMGLIGDAARGGVDAEALTVAESASE